MKVLVVGAYGLFLEAFISRTIKEDFELYVITGSKSKEMKPSGIIEEYRFEYTNENIEYVLESTKADTLLFTGALDSRFNWSDNSDAVSYMGGLTNLLNSASNIGIKRFIYLSLTELYDTSISGIYNENSTLNFNNLREKTIKSGEDLSLLYHNDAMEVIIFRCSEVYGFYNNKLNTQNFCTKLCYELIKEEIPYINTNKRHDFIHVSDVVEVVYRTMGMDKVPHRIYNICSGYSFTENQIFEKILEISGKTCEVKYKSDTEEITIDFSNELAAKELRFDIKHHFTNEFPNLFQQLKEYYLFTTQNKAGDFFLTNLRSHIQSIFKWVFPYFETILAFLVIYLIVGFTNRSSYLQEIDFYMLYIVFIAILYGKGQTITAILLSFLGRIGVIGVLYSLKDAIVDYTTYIWILQILIIGMGIGYVRDRYKQSLADKNESIKYLEAELVEIKEINHSNIRIKKIFENRLINYQDSFARIYSIIAKLDDLEPDKIMFEAVDVVSQIMNSGEVVIYGVDKNSSYARLRASSLKLTNTSPKSIKLDTYAEVYHNILEHKIYVNRTMDSDKPIMAGGVFYNDDLESVVMIWSLPFENTTLYHMNLFSVIINLIAQALHRANLHIEESWSNRYIENTNILNQKSFHKQIGIKKQGSATNLAEYTILKIINEDKSLKDLNDLVVPILRQHDYIGLGNNNNIYVLLTNTNAKEADFVMNRLSQKGIITRKEAAYYE